MNAAKTKAMITDPGHIPIGMTSPAYKFRMTGQGVSEREKRKLPTTCPECGKRMNESSVARHMRQVHHIYQDAREQPVSRRLFSDQANSYTVAFPRGERLERNCPVPDCVGKATNGFDMRKHFAKRHPLDEIIIESEGLLPRCNLCNMHISLAYLGSHQQSELCRKIQSRNSNVVAVQRANAARRLQFNLGEHQLEKVDSFLYLGRWMMSNDGDMLAIDNNVKKARAKWACLSRVLSREGANPKIMAQFYISIVMSVLLYGSETWVITAENYKGLEKFHNTVARKIARLPIKYDVGQEEWIRPSMEQVFQLSGLSPLYDYLYQRRQYVQEFAVNCRLTEELINTNRVTVGQRRLWTDDAQLEELVLNQAMFQIYPVEEGREIGQWDE
jgi:hypothetical protein